MPDTPDLIASLPEMEPSASVRAVAAYWIFHNGERVLPTDQRHPIFAVPKISDAIDRAYRDGQSSALTALQPLIEAIDRLAEAMENCQDCDAEFRALWAARASFPAAPGGMERAARPGAEAPERHCPDHPLNTTSDGAGTLFCATFGCSWRLPVATPDPGGQ